MKRRFVIILATLAPALSPWAAAATPATLRPDARIADSVVRLSDLFDNAGPESARVLGPAPPPGARFTVEAAQLAAIARQYRVDWRPLSEGERVVVERAGRMLSRELVTAALRQAALDAGASGDVEIDVTNFVAPMVSADGPPSVRVEQFDYDAAAGRFSATVLLSGGDADALRLRVAGQAVEATDVVVATRRIAEGEVIQPEDVEVARVRTTLLHEATARRPEQLIGRILRHGASAGHPIALIDSMRPSDVLAGRRVEMNLAAPGLAISAVGVALQNGSVGDTIEVMNPDSRAVIDARITAPGMVSVDPGGRPGKLAPNARVHATRDAMPFRSGASPSDQAAIP